MDPQHRWPPDRAGELAETFVDCADTLVTGFDLVEYLIRLCERCVRLLDIDAAALLLADPQDRLQVMAASTEQAARLGQFQIETGEGPGLDCHRTGAAVGAPDLGEVGDRWLRFAPTCRQAGFAAAHALPMRYHGQVVGAMNLFDRAPGGMSEETARIVQALTDVATIGLLHHRAHTDQVTLIGQLQTAVTSRVAIEQANGMLAERFGLVPEQAFRLLRRHARSHNRRLAELAHAVVAGHVDLSPPEHRTR